MARQAPPLQASDLRPFALFLPGFLTLAAAGASLLVGLSAVLMISSA